MKAEYTVLAIFLALVFLAHAPLAVAAEAGKVTTNVTAEKMVYDSAAQKVMFSNKVKVVHPDFTLRSDSLQLFLGAGGAGQARSSAEGIDPGVVQKIIAESKVNIQLPEGRIATCNKATYRVESETLTMEGSPVLREGQNQIRSDRMVFYLRENRNEAQGKVTVDFISGGEVPSGLNEAGFGGIGGGR